MFAQPLGLAVGTAAMVSALGGSSSSAATLVTREIDVNVATTTSSVAYSSAPNLKTSEFDIPFNISSKSSASASAAATTIVPSKRQKFFIQYFENRTSGLDLNNKVDAYVNWLLEPGFATPSASTGGEVSLLSSGDGELFPDLDETSGELFPELNPYKQKEPDKILPGTCEFKLKKLLQDGLQPAFDLYVRRAGEKRKVEDEKINRPLGDLKAIEEDELWILRYYIRCCTRNSGRGAIHRALGLESRGSVESEDPMLPFNGNTLRGLPKRETAKPQSPTGADPDKRPGSDYDPTKPLHDKDLEVNTSCEQKLLHYQHWTNAYLSWAGETDRYIKDELPKLKPLTEDPKYWSKVSFAKNKRDRVIRGVGRCCRDDQQPGPLPIGDNPFPSVPQEKPFVRDEL